VDPLADGRPASGGGDLALDGAFVQVMAAVASLRIRHVRRQGEAGMRQPRRRPARADDAGREHHEYIRSDAPWPRQLQASRWCDGCSGNASGDGGSAGKHDGACREWLPGEGARVKAWAACDRGQTRLSMRDRP
jgi:hypothetical protein